MNTYYCHACATHNGYLNSRSTEDLNFTGTTYQLEKFVKHTIPPTRTGLISVFDDPDYHAYSGFVVNSIASGSVEVDGQSRVNILWYA